MLGRRSAEDSLETVTQGTFVRELLTHLSKNPARDFDAARGGRPFADDPSCVFRKYFLSKEDGSILKVMLNLFEAQRSVWPEEWRDPDRSILTKSTGFMGTMWALDPIIRAGQRAHDLSRDWFTTLFGRASKTLEAQGKALVAADFPSNSQGIRALSAVFVAALTERVE